MRLVVEIHSDRLIIFFSFVRYEMRWGLTGECLAQDKLLKYTRINVVTFKGDKLSPVQRKKMSSPKYP